MPLIRLLADPEDETLPPPPPLLRGGDFPVEDLLLELRNQRQSAKRREAAFLSVIAHLLLVVILLLSPKLFPVIPAPIRPVRQALDRTQLTYLEMPKDLITKAKPKQPKAISDRDRHFDRSDKIRNSISAPVTRPAPRPTPPPAGPPAQPVPATPPPPVAKSTPAPAAPKSADKVNHAEEGGLKLEDVPSAPTKPKLQLNLGAAAQLERAIEGAARDRTSHSPGVTEVNPLPPPRAGGTAGAAPGQTGAGVQILTDTQGVNFDSYLRRVVEIVRRNWYAVMPETVYLGTQGKVVVIFNIETNGSVPGVHPVSLSGTQSLDQAAVASISASNPFPPLPNEFHGPFITLQFSFYYNLSPEN